MNSENFSINLRSICAEYGSIAQVCRDIGLNRQQFNRYLTNSGMPSAYNLRRIARHFGINEADLYLDPASFEIRHIKPKQDTLRPTQVLSDVFYNQAGPLRRYLGVYHGHFQTPVWPGYIFRSLIWLRDQDGFVVGHTFERAKSKSHHLIHQVRHRGLAAFHGNRIYLVETANSEDRFLSETIMFPAYRSQVDILRGLTTGVASGRSLMPFSSATIWKKLPIKMPARTALAQTGIFPVESNKIDLKIRNALTEAQEEFT